MTKLIDKIFDIPSDYSLIDPTIALGEVYTEAEEIGTTEHKTEQQSLSQQPNNWESLFQHMEACLVNGRFWEQDEAECLSIGEEKSESVYYESGIKHLNENCCQKPIEEVLEEFDQWAGTPLDILSPYGDIDFGSNVFAQDFAVDVPVKIYRKNDDLVLKADIPWIKVNNFSNINLNSSLDLNSVLSVLPIRINSRQVKASFINGEFRLEMPENHEINYKKEVL